MDCQRPTTPKTPKALTTTASNKETPVPSISFGSKPVAVVQPMMSVVSEGVEPSRWRSWRGIGNRRCCPYARGLCARRSYPDGSYGEPSTTALSIATGARCYLITRICWRCARGLRARRIGPDGSCGPEGCPGGCPTSNASSTSAGYIDSENDGQDESDNSSEEI